MIKRLICISLCTIAVTTTVCAEEVNMSLAELSQKATQAVVAYYGAQLNLRIMPRSVTDLGIITVVDNTIEISAIAPTPDKDEGIPYYCEITLKRQNADSEYAVSNVSCSKYD